MRKLKFRPNNQRQVKWTYGLRRYEWSRTANSWSWRCAVLAGHRLRHLELVAIHPSVVSQHTSAVLGVLLSVVVVSRAVQWAIGPGWLQIYMEYSERAVLVMIFLYFPIRVFYDLYEELRSRGSRH